MYDSLFLGAMGTCVAWFVGPVTAPLSYAVGALIGTAYVVLLGQYAATFDVSQQTNKQTNKQTNPLV